MELGTVDLRAQSLFVKRNHMQKAMIFIDYENFEISRCDLYKNEGNQRAPFLDLVEFPKKLIGKIGLELELMKTFLFAPKPDDILKQEKWRQKRFDFLKGLENTNFFTVIAGRHCARPNNGDFASIDLSDKSTYHVNEKGTDINIATQILTKAFHDSYDVAIVVSGDTDYLPVYDVLNTIGKLVIVVGVKGQNLAKLKTHTDFQLLLDYDFLKSCESQYRNSAEE